MRLSDNFFLHEFTRSQTAAGDVTFIYERGISYQSCDLGLKTNASGTDVIASAVTAGTINVLIFVF